MHGMLGLCISYVFTFCSSFSPHSLLQCWVGLRIARTHDKSGVLMVLFARTRSTMLHRSFWVWLCSWCLGMMLGTYCTWSSRTAQLLRVACSMPIPPPLGGRWRLVWCSTGACQVLGSFPCMHGMLYSSNVTFLHIM
jgi:hypothetical protein